MRLSVWGPDTPFHHPLLHTPSLCQVSAPLNSAQAENPKSLVAGGTGHRASGFHYALSPEMACLPEMLSYPL